MASEANYVQYWPLVQIVKAVKVNSSNFNSGNVYKCLPVKLLDYTNVEGAPFSFVEAQDDRAIYCVSLNYAKLIENRYYLAYQVERGKYVVHDQAIFVGLQTI